MFCQLAKNGDMYFKYTHVPKDLSTDRLTSEALFHHAYWNYELELKEPKNLSSTVKAKSPQYSMQLQVKPDIFIGVSCYLDDQLVPTTTAEYNPTSGIYDISINLSEPGHYKVNVFASRGYFGLPKPAISFRLVY